MTWTAAIVERAEPPTVADERTSLQSWLTFHRETPPMRCQGLTGEQLAARPTWPG